MSAQPCDEIPVHWCRVADGPEESGDGWDTHEIRRPIGRRVSEGRSIISACGHKCLLRFVRQMKSHKVRLRIEVVVSRLVDDTDIPLSLSLLIRDELIHLARFKVLALVIVHAQGKSSFQRFFFI